MQAPPSANVLELRRDLTFRVHQPSGKLWYSVLEPISGRLFRLGAREYAIASRLRAGVTSGDIAREVNQAATSNAAQDSRNATDSLDVTEAEVIELTRWLTRCGLTNSDQTSTQPPPRRWMIGLLYSRIPLVNGQRLEKWASIVAPFLTPVLCVGILVSYLVALMCVAAHWELFSTATQSLFVSDGQLWWLVAWLVLKAVHELGHAAVAVRFNCPIRSGGLSIIFFAPIPYVDITDLWSITNRWHRIACCSAGILGELAAASLAAFIAIYTSNESLRYFCCAVATLGTVSTVAFNANPLMKFDGYFIISDLLNLPNLWSQAQIAYASLWKKVLLPWRSWQITWPNPLIALYGGACSVYRFLVLTTLAASAILLWETIGVILVLWGGYATVLYPRLMQLKMRRLQAAMSPGAENNSSYEWLWFSGAITAVSLIFILAPSPIQPTAPGVVAHHGTMLVNAEAQGILHEICAASGSMVEPDEVIAILKNPDLELELAVKRIEVQMTRESIRLKQARGALAMLQSEMARLESLLTQLEQLESRVQRLLIRAPIRGTIVAIPIQHILGHAISIGQTVCLIAPSQELEAVISVDQRHVPRLQQAIGKPLSVSTTNGVNTMGIVEKVDPKGSDYLTEPLLAASYSGPIPVEFTQDAKQQSQLRMLSPRFSVKIKLPSGSGLRPGQMVWIRIPGKSASLMSAIYNWGENRWMTLKRSYQLLEQG
ncbi:MAG: HlyD family efflux transporter periplasmic adaptor subunit [Pirellulaceae bacterium]|nr:HlyD family efflux transporter periplasmic adaptor subunit [Pirellulaceae bacterium]